MKNFKETDCSEYNIYNMELSDNQGPRQQMALMVDSENSRHSTARKGDSALTAFLRSKQQNALSGTQHTNSTFDTFAQEQEWEDDDDVPDDESILSIDIEHDLFALSRYKGADDESIVSLDIINDIKNDMILQPSYNEASEWGDDGNVPDEESIVPIDINDIKNDLIPLSNYNEDAVDEALKWTEAFMDHDDDSDEEFIEDAPLHDSMSSFNDGFDKLTKCMARSAHTRQELARQYSEKSLGSKASTTTDISQHSFSPNDYLQLQNPLGPSSSHSSTSRGLVRPRIIKKTQGLRSGLIRRHSHRSISGQDIPKRAGLVKKASLRSLNSSLNSISLHGNSTWGNLSRNSSFRKPNLSQELADSLMGSSSNLSLRVKARLSQNVNKRRMLDQHFVFAAPKFKPKSSNDDMVQRFSQSMPSITTYGESSLMRSVNTPRR